MSCDQAGQVPFWKAKKLSELTQEEWENLCDGCAQCCRVKVRNERTERIIVSAVACRFLNTSNCLCTRYRDRLKLVQDCVRITAENVESLTWLPDTCAYRLIAAGKDLEEWHPLVHGSRKKMDELGVSVKDQVISERDVHPCDLESYLVRWAK